MERYAVKVERYEIHPRLGGAPCQVEQKVCLPTSVHVPAPLPPERIEIAEKVNFGQN